MVQLLDVSNGATGEVWGVMHNGGIDNEKRLFGEYTGLPHGTVPYRNAITSGGDLVECVVVVPIDRRISTHAVRQAVAEFWNCAEVQTQLTSVLPVSHQLGNSG